MSDPRKIMYTEQKLVKAIKESGLNSLEIISLLEAMKLKIYIDSYLALQKKGTQPNVEAEGDNTIKEK